MSRYEVNVALCEVLGLDPKHVQAVNVKIRPDSYPLVTVRSMMRDPYKVETKRFRLVDEEEKA